MSVEWLTSWDTATVMFWAVLLPVAVVYAAVRWLLHRIRK